MSHLIASSLKFSQTILGQVLVLPGDISSFNNDYFVQHCAEPAVLYTAPQTAADSFMSQGSHLQESAGLRQTLADSAGIKPKTS